MAKKRSFGLNEFGSFASVIGLAMSALALMWTVRPDTIPKQLRK